MHANGKPPKMSDFVFPLSFYDPEEKESFEQTASFKLFVMMLPREWQSLPTHTLVGVYDRSVMMTDGEWKHHSQKIRRLYGFEHEAIRKMNESQWFECRRTDPRKGGQWYAWRDEMNGIRRMSEEEYNLHGEGGRQWKQWCEYVEKLRTKKRVVVVEKPTSREARPVRPACLEAWKDYTEDASKYFRTTTQQTTALLRLAKQMNGWTVPDRYREEMMEAKKVALALRVQRAWAKYEASLRQAEEDDDLWAYIDQMISARD